MTENSSKLDLARAMEFLSRWTEPPSISEGDSIADHRDYCFSTGFLAGYKAGQIDMRQRAADLAHLHSCRPGCVCPEGIAGDIHILPLSPENVSEKARPGVAEVQAVYFKMAQAEKPFLFGEAHKRVIEKHGATFEKLADAERTCSCCSRSYPLE